MKKYPGVYGFCTRKVKPGGAGSKFMDFHRCKFNAKDDRGFCGRHTPEAIKTRDENMGKRLAAMPMWRRTSH